MGVKSLVQGLNAAATAGFEPRTVWSEVRHRNRLATAPPFLKILKEIPSAGSNSGPLPYKSSPYLLKIIIMASRGPEVLFQAFIRICLSDVLWHQWRPFTISKFQWKPFWLATQLYLQNDWLGANCSVCYGVCAQAQSTQWYMICLPANLGKGGSCKWTKTTQETLN